jgi:hypothetical protein
MDLIKPFLGAGSLADGADTTQDLDLSTHGAALRRLLNGAGASNVSGQTAGDGTSAD